jgi:hypothetical protein
MNLRRRDVASLFGITSAGTHQLVDHGERHAEDGQR